VEKSLFNVGDLVVLSNSTFLKKSELLLVLMIGAQDKTFKVSKPVTCWSFDQSQFIEFLDWQLSRCET
jgi:hypothetical protein